MTQIVLQHYEKPAARRHFWVGLVMAVVALAFGIEQAVPWLAAHPMAARGLEASLLAGAATGLGAIPVLILLGLTPVFVDVQPDTFTIDLVAVEKAITPRTRCIMPVHLYGQSADMEKLMQIAEKHRLYIIEDNAQAIGADYRFSNGATQKKGTIGHIGCTSFYPSKNLGCYGDGGAIFTNDDLLAEKIRLIANHGQRTKYDSSVMGLIRG